MIEILILEILLIVKILSTGFTGFTRFPGFTRLLFQQLLNHFPEYRDLIFIRAQRDIPHDAFAIDQIRRRYTKHSIVKLVEVPLRHRKPVRQRIPLPEIAQVNKLFSRSQRTSVAVSIVLRHAQNHESLALVRALPARKVWKRVAAWTTPRRPEVKQHHLAAKIGEFNRLQLDPLLRNYLRQNCIRRRQTGVEQLIYTERGIDSG